MQEIILTESLKKNLIKHANNENPNESCAILFGKIKNGKRIVQEIFFTKNTDVSPFQFTISNEELIKGYKMAEDKNTEVIGIFHSHPNSEAFPSKTDKKFMEVNPVVWLIYSGLTNEFRAFILETEIVEFTVTNEK